MKTYHKNSEGNLLEPVDRHTTESEIDYEQRYEALFSSSLFCVYLLDFEGNILDANDGALKLLGYTRDDIPLYNITSLVEEDQAPLAFQVMEEIKQNGAQQSPVEFKVKKKDGEHVWLEVEGVLLKKDGEPYAILGIAQNATAHKIAEQILEESKNRYQSIFENTGTAIVIVEDDTTISMMNKECEDLTGYSKEEVEGKKSWTEFVVGEEVERLRSYHHLRRTEPSLAPRTYETCMIDKQGNVRNIIVTTAMIPNTNQSVASLLDITEQRVVESALEQSEAKFRGLVEQIPNTIVYTAALDERSTTLYISPQITQVLGYTQEECKKTPDLRAQCIHPDDFSRVMAELEHCRRTGEPFLSEYRMRRKDGMTIWFRDEAHIIRDRQGKPLFLLGINTDITARRRIEEDLRKAKDGLELSVEERTAELMTVNRQLEAEIAERKRAEKSLREINETLEQHVGERTAALRESEERLRFALETSLTGAWDLDLRDHTVYRTLEHDRIFGYVELLPQWTYEIFLSHVLPEDRMAVNNKFRQAIKSHSDWSFECRIRRTTGEIRWIWAAGRLRMDSEGKARLMAGIVQDITDRKLAEQELRERQEDLEKQAKYLQEMNAALNVLLRKRETDRAELEKNILLNIRQVIDPYLVKLERSGLNERQKALTDVLQSNLKEITSSFAYTLSSVHLDMTPKEVKVASLIRQGKTTKEICEILGSSEKAVTFHRQNIRKKLGLLNKKVNLKSHLSQFWRDEGADSREVIEYNTDRQST